MMLVENKYEIGSVVYLKTDREQLDRLITGILVIPIGHSYRLSSGPAECWAYEIEISEDKNVLINA